MAAVYLAEAYGRAAVELPLPFVSRTRKRWDPVLEMARRGVNAPLTSSAGRLFDAVAALVGIRDHVNYEGQAAIELEQVADPTDDAAYDCPVGQVDGKLILDGVALVQAVAEDLKRGASPARVSVAFHRGLARGLVASCREIREETGLGDVALSGGTFQNLMLLGMTVKELKEAGFTVYLHRRVPPNDGGIALGQVAVAARRAEEGKASPTP
jgi:hydrogenase maturation protein HypF